MTKYELEDQIELYKSLLRQQSSTIDRLWESVDNQRARLILMTQDLDNLKKEGESLKYKLNFYRRKRLKDQTKEAEIEKAFHDFTADERTDN